jgi:hypothetical protein
MAQGENRLERIGCRTTTCLTLQLLESRASMPPQNQG